MTKKAALPYDVRLECIAYVRGYPRRVQECARAGGRYPAMEIIKMQAVEHALANCGRDIANDNIRHKLAQSIMRNCQGTHKYSRNKISIPGISEATFSRRKEKFLRDIAIYSGMIAKVDTNSGL